MIEKLYAAFKESAGICTDTRKINTNDMFFALKGPNFNANDFARKALAEGCQYAVVDEPRPEFESDERFFVVDDALETLQELARYHRRKLRIPIVALTGSNGKTTTKELMKAALSQQYECYATAGNLNNHIGVALTLLEINATHEIAIIEMGANHQKEIGFLCSIAEPEYGLITNIGIAHLEGFGGEEGVYKGKKELFDYLRSSGGRLFINMDDPKVRTASVDLEGITYGSGNDPVYQGSASIDDGKLTVKWWRDHSPETKYTIHTQLSGIYNFTNVMAAVAVARYFGVPEQHVVKGIGEYTPSNQRSQVVKSKRFNTIIVDCYNANPSSMKAALENVSAQQAPEKILILGDMLELGEHSVQKHQEVVDAIAEMDISKAWLVGEFFSAATITDPRVSTLPSTEKLAARLQAESPKEALVLLKGSRRMKLESLLDLL